MSTATEARSENRPNIFDEDITTAYSLDLPAPRTDAYAIHVYKTISPDEQYMLTAFHKQYVAVEGRSAIGQLVDTRIGDMTIHAAHVMGVSMESVERIETAAHLGRLSRRLQGFDDKLAGADGPPHAGDQRHRCPHHARGHAPGRLSAAATAASRRRRRG